MYVNINVSNVHIHSYDYLLNIIKAEYLVKILGTPGKYIYLRLFFYILFIW